MSIETRSGVLESIIEALKRLANKDTIESADDIELIMINPDFIKAWDNIENGDIKREAEQAANVTGGSSRSNKSKLNKTYKAEVKDVSNTKKMSTENLEKMIKTLNGDEKEIVDD